MNGADLIYRPTQPGTDPEWLGALDIS